MSKIVVTAGLGFIGSHTFAKLQNQGFEVVVIDDLSNSSVEVLEGIERITGKKAIFSAIDLREKSAVPRFFAAHDLISAYGNTDTANKILGWKTVSTLEEAMDSAWKREQKIRNSKYQTTIN